MFHAKGKRWVFFEYIELHFDFFNTRFDYTFFPIFMDLTQKIKD